MGVHDIVGAVRPQKFPDSLPCPGVKGTYGEPGEDTGQVDLFPSVTPDLGDGPCAGSDRDPVTLEDSKHRSDPAVTLVDRDEGARVDDGRHAAPRRRVVRSAAAAVSSSSSLNGPASASHRSKATPSN